MRINIILCAFVSAGLGFVACNQGGDHAIDTRQAVATDSKPASGDAGAASKKKERSGFRLAAPSLPSNIDASKFVIVLFGKGGSCIALSSQEPLAGMVASLTPTLGGMCLMQQIASPYAPGVNLGINNILAGSYRVGLGVLNSSNILIQFGIQSVEVSAGVTNQVTIQLQNVGSLPRGNIDISVKQADPAPVATAPAVLAIASLPLDQTVGTCGRVSFSLRDALNTPTLNQTGSVISFNPLTTSTTGKFYADANCSVPTSASAVAVNQNSVDIYYSDNVAGIYSISATVDPILKFSNTFAQQIRINSSSDTTLKMTLGIVSPPLRQPPGSCGPVSYRVVYESGVAVSNFASGVVFSPTTTSVFGQFFSDASCLVRLGVGTIPAYQGGVTIYYSDAVTGSPQLSAVVDAHLGFAASPSQTVLISHTANP